MTMAEWHGVNYAIMRVLNQFVGRSFLLDHAAHDLTKDSFSNAPMTALIWYSWWARNQDRRRTGIVAGVLATVLTTLLCYKLQALLPEHLRPLHDPGLKLRISQSINPDVFSRGAAFPSEHATLLFGLAATIWLTDRRLGSLAAAFASCCMIARVYLGFLFPSDVIAGAMLGVLAVGLVQAPWLLERMEKVAPRTERSSALAAALAFYGCFETGRLFEDYRYVAAGIVSAARSHVSHQPHHPARPLSIGIEPAMAPSFSPSRQQDGPR